MPANRFSQRSVSHSGATLRKLALLWLLMVTACSGSGPTLTPLTTDAVILAFGDSLTYGTGAPAGASYPQVLAASTGLSVIGEGIPGEESDAGLARLPKLLEEIKPDLVILGHGGNDMLRKRNLDQTKANLKRMVELARSSGASVVLLGIPKPGVFLSTHPMYEELRDELNVPVEDSALADILGERDLKADTVHPNAAGYALLAEAVQTLLRQHGAID